MDTQNVVWLDDYRSAPLLPETLVETRACGLWLTLIAEGDSCTLRVCKNHTYYVRGGEAGSCTLLCRVRDRKAVVGFEIVHAHTHLALMTSTAENLLETLLLNVQIADLNTLVDDRTEGERGSTYPDLLAIYSEALYFVRLRHPYKLPQSLLEYVGDSFG